MIRIILIALLIAPITAQAVFTIYVDKPYAQMDSNELEALQALKTSLNKAGTAWEIRLLTPQVSKSSTPTGVASHVQIGFGPVWVGVPF